MGVVLVWSRVANLGTSFWSDEAYSAYYYANRGPRGIFFGTLLAVGVLGIFAFQVFENIGMTMGIMPITGIPLPFMSYGGSAIIASFIAIGLVANVNMRRFS